MKSCAFAGHRPEKMPWGKDENSPAGIEFKFRLREALEYLIGRGYTDFLSGGSRGFDLMVFVSSHYEKSVNFRRNAYLVDNAQMLLACFNGDQRSGTGQTVRYAHQKGIKVSILRPERKAMLA